MSYAIISVSILDYIVIPLIITKVVGRRETSIVCARRVNFVLYILSAAGVLFTQIIFADLSLVADFLWSKKLRHLLDTTNYRSFEKELREISYVPYAAMYSWFQCALMVLTTLYYIYLSMREHLEEKEYNAAKIRKWIRLFFVGATMASIIGISVEMGIQKMCYHSMVVYTICTTVVTLMGYVGTSEMIEEAYYEKEEMEPDSRMNMVLAILSSFIFILVFPIGCWLVLRRLS